MLNRSIVHTCAWRHLRLSRNDCIIGANYRDCWWEGGEPSFRHPESRQAEYIGAFDLLDRLENKQKGTARVPNKPETIERKCRDIQVKDKDVSVCMCILYNNILS